MKKRSMSVPPGELVMKLLAAAGIVVILFIFIFVFMKAAPTLARSGPGLITETGFDRQVAEAFAAAPDTPAPAFGLWGLIAGTALSTLLALAAATALGVGAAVAIGEFAPAPLASALLGLVRLLSAIPSVIFGLIGVMFVVPWVESAFISVDMQIEYLDFFQMTGRNLLSSVIVLTFMIAPMVITLSADAIAAVPDSLRETGLAFGMGRSRVVFKLVLPSARNGIVAGVILGAGRGIGEAIAVSMVCGGVGVLPSLRHGVAALFTPVLPLSAAIINKSEAMSSPAVESALFACGAVLLVIGAALSALSRLMRLSRLRRSEKA
ncbi:MAG: phosphate ABC transporter permease subunit PstC [Oscillospiraceae bacterium]|jgi:phosphate ABC transporter permease protein PstC|nr:phosphate ABC transporter permease subunit PstC [Oscillospiraceae bacterium]